jgi:hypothetical protein
LADSGELGQPNGALMRKGARSNLWQSHTRKKANNMTRKKIVGDFGEELIERLLKRAGFDSNSIRDLNHRRYNHPGGDFLAKRAAIEYFISVKTRNKYKKDDQGTRRLNGGYNLYPEKVRRAGHIMPCLHG